MIPDTDEQAVDAQHRNTSDTQPPDRDLADKVDGRIRAATRRVPAPFRRVLVTLVGGTMLLVGIIMIVTPGPALLLIPAGLAVLATEYHWARRLVRRVRARLTGDRKQS